MFSEGRVRGVGRRAQAAYKARREPDLSVAGPEGTTGLTDCADFRGRKCMQGMKVRKKRLRLL